MTKIRIDKTMGLKLGVVASFLAIGSHLIVRSHISRVFLEEAFIYDMIWMDALALLFFASVLVVWLAHIESRTRAILCLALLSFYGMTMVSLMYSGTPFGLNGVGGDQLFRTAMILKFSKFLVPGDFYYKGLPPFYPPLYYLVLSIYARLFSVEAFKMIQVGSILIYLVGPWLLYMLWRKIVSPLQALLITGLTFLHCSYGPPYLQSVPHAFVANSLFIPWWLHYIEGVGRPGSERWFLVGGGMIGALIFATYWYPFLLGGLLLIARPIVTLMIPGKAPLGCFRWRRVIPILGLAALFAMPYWAPYFLSILEHGLGHSQGGWHHAGSVGIRVLPMDFSFTGVLFLAGVVYSVSRYRSTLHRGILLLLAVILPFLLIGSLLGAKDMSLLLIKSREFVVVMWGAFVGLGLAGLLRRYRGSVKARRIAGLLLSVLILIMLDGFNSFGKSTGVETARKSRVSDWGLDPVQMRTYAGGIFLTSEPVLFCYYPVYSFIAHNEHYSHPASQFKDRFDFLDKLQTVTNPALFWLGLRFNRFDPVDCILAMERSGQFEIRIFLSNYPNGFDERWLKFPTEMVADTMFFYPRQGRGMFELAPALMSEDLLPGHGGGSASTAGLGAAEKLRPYLTENGRHLLDSYFKPD